MDELKQYLNLRNQPEPTNIYEYKLQKLGPVFEELKKIFKTPYKLNLTSNEIEIKYNLIQLMKIIYEFKTNTYIIENVDINDLPQTDTTFNILVNFLEKYNLNHSENYTNLHALNQRKELLKNKNIKIIKTEIDNRCEQTEYFFYKIFQKKSKYYNKGILIYLNSQLIGLIKLKGTKLMLSLKTKNPISKNQTQIPLEEFGLYEFSEKDLKKINKYNFLTKYKKNKNKDFYRVNIINTPNLKTTNKYTDHLLNPKRIDEILNEQVPHDIEDTLDWANFEEFLEKENYKQVFTENINRIYNENKDITKFDKTIKL
jgi:hypothetical protein